MNFQKISVKIADTGWVHFCYVPSDLKEEFDYALSGQDSSDWIKKWAKEDFNMKLSGPMTAEELVILKEKIKERYQKLYPELYIDSATDNQGWTRTWYTSNMKSEMEKVR